jgi:hypothetical protein
MEKYQIKKSRLYFKNEGKCFSSNLTVHCTLFYFYYFQATAIKERIGYPDFILDPEKLDKKFETVCN